MNRVLNFSCFPFVIFLSDEKCGPRVGGVTVGSFVGINGQRDRGHKKFLLKNNTF